MKYSFPAFENGFIRAAAASPALRVADCAYNADQIIGVMREYAEKNVQLLCLPEFALTGYTCSDLFLQQTLYESAEKALMQVLEASRELNMVVLVGLPVQVGGKLKGTVTVPLDSDDQTCVDAALALDKVAKMLETMQVVKTIVVKNKLVNVVMKPKA